MIRQNAVQETVSPAFDMKSHASSRLSETAPQGENGLKASATGMATGVVTGVVTGMATGMVNHAWHAGRS